MNTDKRLLKRLLKICTEFREGILGKRPSAGMCSAVSLPLQALLAVSYHIETTLMIADFVDGPYRYSNHVWLVLSDNPNFVIDPTADQFSTPDLTYPPVHIGPPLPIHAQCRPFRSDMARLP